MDWGRTRWHLIGVFDHFQVNVGWKVDAIFLQHGRRIGDQASLEVFVGPDFGHKHTPLLLPTPLLHCRLHDVVSKKVHLSWKCPQEQIPSGYCTLAAEISRVNRRSENLPEF